MDMEEALSEIRPMIKKDRFKGPSKMACDLCGTLMRKQQRNYHKECGGTYCKNCIGRHEC